MNLVTKSHTITNLDLMLRSMCNTTKARITFLLLNFIIDRNTKKPITTFFFLLATRLKSVYCRKII